MKKSYSTLCIIFLAIALSACGTRQIDVSEKVSVNLTGQDGSGSVESISVDIEQLVYSYEYLDGINNEDFAFEVRWQLEQW